MLEKAFLITIDTEGDDLWSSPREITTENARYLPRFQELCERYGFKPVYLTNYEMIMDEFYKEFAADVIRRGTGEIGMHLHAWNSPPTFDLTGDDYRYLPYLIEYPENIVRRKVEYITKKLEDTLQVKMVSHRAGRWAMNRYYVGILDDLGYQVDCSVTPGVSWKLNKGSPFGKGGSDYRRSPEGIYYLAGSSVLEITPTICNKYGRLREGLRHLSRVISGQSESYQPKKIWIRPTRDNVDEVIDLLLNNKDEKEYYQFMLHSSELMPGGSPTFRTPQDIERLYADLERIFDTVRLCGFKGTTLKAYAGALKEAGVSLPTYSAF